MKRGTLIAAVCTTSMLTSAAYAEVWEFDRQGNVLRSPDMQPPDNVYYDGTPLPGPSGPSVSVSTRSVNGIVYRPMAEGVAAVYAKAPAVAAAGLDEAEFVRLFFARIDQESRFDPAAVSPKGALGLGQLMPETAAPLGVDAPSRFDPSPDPSQGTVLEWTRCHLAGITPRLPSRRCPAMR